MKKKYDPEYLDQEEKEIIEDLKKIDISNIEKPKKEEQREIRKSASDFVRQEAKMNIRIDPIELGKIKEQAAKEGLKYQSFIKSILHKYITGQLIEKEKAAG
jgi:predicted DNA binding CopG/RHH family protein